MLKSTIYAAPSEFGTASTILSARLPIGRNAGCSRLTTSPEKVCDKGRRAAYQENPLVPDEWPLWGEAVKPQNVRDGEGFRNPSPSRTFRIAEPLLQTGRSQ